MPPPAPRGGGQRKKRMTSYRQSSRSVTPSAAATPPPAPQLILPPTSTPQFITQPTAQPSTSTKAAQNNELAKRYKCKQCPPDEADIRIDDSGLIVCVNCGTVISNNNQLQNEVSFGENAQGAAVVQGTTLQEGQRRTHLQGLGHRGAEAPDADTRLHHATQQGKELIEMWGRDMYIGKEPARILNRAVNLYSLAKLHAFQRPVPENSAIALYTACREEPQNEVLLIDLAERISVNVFELGAAYKKFLDRIGLTEKYGGKETISQRMVEPEPLIQRFAKRLEFGNDCKKVATDACSILARMRRDWMVEGRQPMGLVGACLIIAARMNNYRRTLREVVYVVRAGEMTILKRLNEFSTTAAARLTVDQFRQLNEDELLNASLKQALPPSLSHPRRKRQKKNHDYESISSSRQSSLAPSEADSEMSDMTETEPPRRDKDGFLVPALPARARSQSTVAGSPPPIPASSIDPAIQGDDDEEEEEEEEESEEPRRKRGRPPKMPLPKIDPTTDDLAAEAEVEKEIATNLEAIENDETIAAERGEGWFRAKVLADAARAQEAKVSGWKLSDLDALGETIEEDEFENDPEVQCCKLTEREAEVKERIWVTNNHDWLRAQQERLLQEQLAQARGKKKRQGPRKKMARRGDGSVLGESPAESAADASSKMMASRSKRHKYSRHVNYKAMQRIYGDDTGSEAGTSPPGSAGSRAGSRTPSVARSIAPASPSPAPSAKGKQRSVSFASDTSGGLGGVRTPSPAPSASAGAKRPAPEDDDVDEDDDEEAYQESVGLEEDVPTFADDDDDEEEYYGDARDMEDAVKFGDDVGDGQDEG